MAYTTIDDPTAYFQTKIYSGNGSSQNITGLDFAPNWVWVKSRSDARQHALVDTVRGVNQEIASNLSAAEFTAGGTGSITAFTSDGFSLGGSGDVNNNGSTFVSWNWKAGTSFTNDASSTGVGSIDSAGSVSTDAGFSIVTYTGSGSAATIGHGLGSTPACYMIKQRNTTGGWIVYHKGNTSSPETDYLRLDKTDATVDDAIFNDTAPTSSVFSIGTNAPVNTSGGTYVAYCFAEKTGYSKFGSYTGNGNADGAFVYLGFSPSFVMTKRTDSTSGWHMQDNKRDGFNYNNHRLFANSSGAEETTVRMDLLSNGFKYRDGDGNYGTNIYMAFAENPIVTSTGIPGTAR